MVQSRLITRITTAERIMALTFDDGSDASNLLDILSILKENGIKSTFFLTGEAVEAHPALVRLIVEQGHEVGNHSYSHPDFTTIGAAAMENEIRRAENVMSDIMGVNPRPLFRPPYGAYNQTVLNTAGSMGYGWTLMWTIDTIDWNGTPSGTMVQKVLNNAQPGAIVLMHVGGGTNTVEALPQMISGLKSRGYNMVTISRLLSLPQSPARQMLWTGAVGESVRYLQESLIKLGFNPGSVDGVFGPQTDAAVRAYQSSRGLTVDGIVGDMTWSSIESELKSPSNPPSSNRPLISQGSTGEAVRYLQQTLSGLGFNPGPIDGIFGSRTDIAVRLFQSSRNLVVDGIVGPQTWATLDGAPQNPPQNPPPAAHPVLRQGSAGDEVRYLQEALMRLGFNPGHIDGLFGPQTDFAVKAFQASRGLSVDGIVGNMTWAAIDNEIK